MPFARPAEARLEQIVRRERGEARGQRARAAHHNSHDGGFQIVVGDARRHCVEVREGADVAIEKADLVLALVDPGEVAARVHQPHEKEPRLAADAADVDEDLEEVDLREIARAIRQRHEDLTALPLPLRHRILDDRDAHLLALSQQQLVQPRGRQPLFAAGPSDRVHEQRLHPRGHRVPHRPRPRRRRRRPDRRHLAHILADRRPGEPQLSCHRPLRPSLDEYLMPHHMYLIHPEHPLSGPQIPRSGKPALDPQVAYFPSGEWPTF